MPNYRTPSAKETEKLERARAMMRRGIEGESDMMSRLMPTMAKSARDEMRAAKALRESVPASAREGEAYNQAGYAKGGKIRKFRYDEGGEVDYGEDERPAATGMSDAAELMPEKPKPKPAPKPKPKAASPFPSPSPSPAPSPSPQRVEVTGKRLPKDDESKSVSERMKAARERARAGGTSTDDRSVTERMGGSERKSSSGSTDTRSISDRMKAMRESARSSSTGTDTRSVGQRIRGALGFAKGGVTRADGCAKKGHTKGRMV